jgi:hypothetical protein
MRITPNAYVPPGVQVLWRDGMVVWSGPIGAPIEDVECDMIQVNPKDYERIKATIYRADQ